MGFNKSNSIGKIAERRFDAVMTDREWITSNVSGHKLFQELDIDYIVSKGNQVVTVDVKGDRNKNNNFFIETVSNVNTGSDGCIIKTRADYWFYYFFCVDTFYYFKPQRMREYIHDRPLRKAYGYTETQYGGYQSEGLLVPISDCSHFVSVLE